MVDIIIVNWNSGNLLRECICSINKKNQSVVNKVIVIDNNSADHSDKNLSTENNIELIKNSENLGFAKACNQGFRKSTADFILLLNPDAKLLQNTLSDCVDFMFKNPDVDILGCKLLNDEGNLTYSCARFPTPLRIFFDACGLSKISPRIFTPSTIMTDWDHKSSREVDEVMGAFMFIRRNVFEKIGYMDERFFVYYEELDYCKRLSLKGGKTYYNSDITAIHTGEGTTQFVKGFRLFLNLRSRLLYAQKYFTKAGYLLVWFSTFFIEPFKRIFFLLFTGKFKETGEIFKCFILLIKNKSIQS